MVFAKLQYINFAESKYGKREVHIAVDIVLSRCFGNTLKAALFLSSPQKLFLKRIGLFKHLIKVGNLEQILKS